MRYRSLFASLLLLGSAAAVFVYLKSSRPQKQPVTAGERIWQVDVRLAERRTLAPLLPLYGQVGAAQVFRAVAPLASQVRRMAVVEGQPVERGQLLMELDPQDFEPVVVQAQADVAELQARIDSELSRYASDQQSLRYDRELLALAKAAVDRNDQLQRKKLGSEQTLDEARQAVASRSLTLLRRELDLADHPSRLKQLQAALQRAEARLQQRLLDRQRSRVLAPFDGRVSGVSASEGDYLKQFEVGLEMYAYSALQVRARIPVSRHAEVVAAMERSGALRGIARAHGEQLELSLQRLAGVSESAGVEALFAIGDGDHDRVRPGQLLTIDLLLQQQEGVIELPRAGLYGEDKVFVVREGRLQGLQVEVLGAAPTGDQHDLLIRSDEIADGEPILVTQLPNAISGMRVDHP